MNKSTILIFAFLLALPLIQAMPILANTNIYVDVNTTFPLVLIPLDSNVVNIYLNINGTSMPFTWTGTEYTLNILFNSVGNYPFVINSTNVTGEIVGVFLVRVPFNVTFSVLNDKTGKVYKNNFAYILANRNLVPTSDIVNKYFVPFDKTSQIPYYHAQYTNGYTTLKFWDKGYYSVRLKDGLVDFNGYPSFANFTKSYGTDIYIGNLYLNGTNQVLAVFVSDADIHPYRALFNYFLVGFIVIIFLLTLALLFINPNIAIMTGVGLFIMALILRAILWIFVG